MTSEDASLQTAARDPPSGREGRARDRVDGRPDHENSMAVTLVARRLCVCGGAATQRGAYCRLACAASLGPYGHLNLTSSRHARRTSPVWFRLRRVRERSSPQTVNSPQMRMQPLHNCRGSVLSWFAPRNSVADNALYSTERPFRVVSDGVSKLRRAESGGVVEL
jgi:hypothetical protein